ncbi:MAG: isoleucyl-tRNA synthetase, partial [Gaiellaceae bacterium]|nr:isoleucyl-tRNA synthetase [Gaiellaceae bacterium]
HAYWEQWFPADWVSEMREQIRLWFYSQLFMSVALVGTAPFKRVLGYEKMLDETGREMHGSWGNMIDAEDAFERMGADVVRWQFCAQPPTSNLLFGFGPAEEIKRRLLTLWNSVSFFVTYANIEGFEPRYADLEAGPDCELRPLDSWLVARTQQLVAEATAEYEDTLTFRVIRAFERFVEDVSNWYIRRSRKRFYSYDEAAFRSLWYALVQGVRVIAPVAPFLAEHLWENLVAGPCDGAPDSVFLARWPEQVAPDETLLAEVAEVRRVVELARSARSQAELKLRQPLRRLVVQGAPLAEGHADEIAEEMRVKEVVFGPVEAVQLRVKPELRALGPKLGKDLPRVRAALEAGEFEQLGEGRIAVLGFELGPEEVLVERSAVDGWALAEEEGVTVAISTDLDDGLLLEGRVLDLVHKVNGMRKDAGLALTDRIALTLPRSDEDLLPHTEQIKDEVLAVSIELDADADGTRIAKA